jgi:signal peptidase I
MPERQKTDDEAPRDGIRETLESIAIALVLAFVFRAFIVEAFVIPTGSMAPTLYGAHGTIVCEDCGTEFAYGLQDLREGRGRGTIRATDRAVCPNCSHANTNLTISDEARNAESGDRILVLKWPFDIGMRLLGPSRWDVVVFKDPADGTTNFIKRMVGTPNEVLMIVDGDVYTVPTAELAAETLAELDRLRHEKYEIRTGQRHKELRRPPASVLTELDAKMKIARKTAVAQESLWFPVYDHDHPSPVIDKTRPHWKVRREDESGWSTGHRRVRFEDRGLRNDSIGLAGPAIRAQCAYNIQYDNAHHRLRNTPPPYVSDLRLRFVLTPGSASGRIRLSLEKLGRTFAATIHMDGQVSIEETGESAHSGERVALQTQIPPFVPGRSVQISYENLDYRLALSIGGKEVLASSDDPDDAGYYRPNLAKLRLRREPETHPGRPSIFAEGGNFELTHLVVDRDVHYYLAPSHGLPHPWRRSYDTAAGWGTPENPMLLRGHEYFMLGDNPAASKDSRLWDTLGPHLAERGEECQLGAVPEDQLIGQAFFVYWPSMQRADWLDWFPLLRRWGIVPDVGRMRWIR